METDKRVNKRPLISRWQVIALGVIMVICMCVSSCGAGKETYRTRMARKEQENMKKIQEQKKQQERQRAEWQKRQEEKKRLAGKMQSPEGVDKEIYIDYLAFFGPEWKFKEITAEKPVAEFKKYFGATEYRVIWYWDIDGCGYNDYLAVEVYPKVRRGIKRGILVDELGRVKMYIDTLKGIYTPEYEVLSFKLLGHKPGEVECYSIGYIPWTGEGKGFSLALGETNKGLDGIREHEKELGNTGSRYNIGQFDIQRIDKDLKVIGTEYDNKNAAYRMSDFLVIYYYSLQDKCKFSLFEADVTSGVWHQRKKELIQHYRQWKKEGKAFSPPEKLDRKDVENALKIKMMY